MEGFLSFRLTFWIGLVSIILVSSPSSGESIKSFSTEDLCHQSTASVIDLAIENTGILTSFPYERSYRCKILLKAIYRHPVILSIAKYFLNDDDQLIIEDSDHHKISLIGSGNFPDERKSIVSDGDITIHYSKNSTHSYSKAWFQFTFTMARNGPCKPQEFKCRNEKCIPDDLPCDGHNHCGDNSDQAKCGLTETEKDESPPTPESNQSKVWIITVIVGSVILAVVVIIFVAVLIRGIVKRKKEPLPVGHIPQPTVQSSTAQPSTAQPPTVQVPTAQLPTVQSPTAQPPTAQPPTAQPPTLFSQIRRSFRGNSKAEHAPPPETHSEAYQVPSMYPQIPSAPDFPGIHNPEYHADE